MAIDGPWARCLARVRAPAAVIPRGQHATRMGHVRVVATEAAFDAMTSDRPYRRAMSIDKKVQSGRVRLILLKRIGEAFITGDYPEIALDAALAAHTGRGGEARAVSRASV